MWKTRVQAIWPYMGMPILLLLLVVFRYRQIEDFMLLQYGLLLAFSYLASVWDIRVQRISNRFLLFMLSTWLFTNFIHLLVHTDLAIRLLKNAALGFVIGGGLFLLVYIISHKGLGGADVKFMAVAGLYLGFESILSAMLYGSILAALFGGILVLLKKISKKDTIPLVPFLFLGILITVFCG